jgi:hypothetical protein
MPGEEWTQRAEEVSPPLPINSSPLFAELTQPAESLSFIGEEISLPCIIKFYEFKARPG